MMNGKCYKHVDMATYHNISKWGSSNHVELLSVKTRIQKWSVYNKTRFPENIDVLKLYPLKERLVILSKSKIFHMVVKIWFMEIL